METLAGAAAESLFFPAYEAALVSASVGSAIEREVLAISAIAMGQTARKMPG